MEKLTDKIGWIYTNVTAQYESTYIENKAIYALYDKRDDMFFKSVFMPSCEFIESHLEGHLPNFSRRE